MKPLLRTTVCLTVLASALACAGSSLAAPNAVVQGVSDGPLRGELEAAIGEARAGPGSVLDARRRAIQAAKDAIALLRSEGYYDGAAHADFAATTSSRAVVAVAPGPRFHLKSATVAWEGKPPDPATGIAVATALRLPAGAPGRAADILAAEGRVIAALQKHGYAEAALRPREVIVDHADQSVRPTLRIAAGGRIRLGATNVVGKEKTRPRWVAGLAPWKPGTIYDPALLAKLEKRLIDTGAYESASVALAPAGSDADAPRTVDVTLADRKARSLELGAGYSTTEGSGVDAKFTVFNRLGLGDSLILTARGYDIQQKLDLEQDLPDWFHGDQTLKVGGGFLGDRTAAYDDLGGGVRLDVVRKFDRTTSVSLGAAFDFASTREKDSVNVLGTPVGESLDLYITTLKAGFVLDHSNSILNPTRGWRIQVEADPTWVAGDRDLAYLKSVGEVTGYLPLVGDGTVLAVRGRLGSIVGGSIPDVPADRRFFAGGGGSVRGYGYQDVGPKLSDGTPVGGVSLTEGSVEVRQRLTQRLGLVAFADVGGLGSGPTPQFTGLSVGAGLGVRYDLGFGPLRIDLGTPVNSLKGNSPVQVYISIGQAF